MKITSNLVTKFVKNDYVWDVTKLGYFVGTKTDYDYKRLFMI